MTSYKYIYGPVNSWRLGSSLGIDLLSQRNKVCTFDCSYCQVGRAKSCPIKRKTYIPTKAILDEIRSLPECRIDYITFSGSGEPTLAKNLGTLIRSIKKIRKEKIAVLTNATLISRKDVQKELKQADLVEVKLDASSDLLLNKINKPFEGIKFKKIIRGIKSFRATYEGKFILQIMLLKESLKEAEDIAKIAKSIKPDKIHINTPLRPSKAKPISRKEMENAKAYFKGMRVITVYDKNRKKSTKPIDKKSTIKRRGKL